MQCLECQHDNLPDAAFCEDCGAKLDPSCPQCQTDNRATSKFCRKCGTPLTASGFTAGPDEADQQPVLEGRFYAIMSAVTALRQRDRRITYRTLKDAFQIDDTLLAEILEELALRRLAFGEEGNVLVWTEEPQSAPPASHASSRVSAENMEFPSTALPAATPSPTMSPETNGATLSAEDTPTAATPDKLVAALEPARSIPEAERRQLTVMFCDLVGSTDLSGKLDPEDLREVVRAYQETAAEVIQRYEGHIAQYLGDGLLIYFGFPVAHEDDAQRALYTGLGIPEAMATLNTRLKTDYGVELAVRIGIHTGPVVVGEMGGGGRHENLALGETPNIAARLEGLAQANTAVISPVTAQLVQRSFMLEELGPHELKGVSEPMILYSVIGSRESDYDDHESMLGGFESLVGRDEEIGLLLRRWEQSKDGQGQVVLISGEAGLGKSSLVEALRAHARQEGYTRIAFRCSPYTENSALYPVIEHVQQVLDWQREDAAETRLAKLEQGLAGYQFPSEESVPLLASLLSLSLPEDRYPALGLTPQQQRQQTLDTLVSWMLEDAERQPLLAVWEDLHWADPSTLELLGQLIDEVPTVAMMNVLAYRPVFTPPWPIQQYVTPLVLNRLERTHIEALMERLARGKPLPAEVTAHIVTKTDGVPLYVEELTKMLLESDLLQEEANVYRLMGSLSDATIPTTLQDSLMARLDQLPEARQVAQLGAVLGREFPYEMLQALTEVGELRLQERLTQLVDHNLLYQRGRLPKATYIFRHALIRDAAYQSLLRRTQKQYHDQVAQLLEARFPDMVETQPELAAHHYTEAGLADQAITYWQWASQRASKRSAHQESINHLTSALNLLETQPETLARHERELPLQTALGSALNMIKGNGAPEVEAAYRRAHLLCQQLGDTQDVFQSLFGLWRSYVGNDPPLARQLGEELLELAHGEDEGVRSVFAHYALGATCMWRGELLSACRHLEASLTHYHPSLRRSPMFQVGQDPGVGGHALSSITICLQGYPDQSRAHVHEALLLARQIDHPISYGYALIQTSIVLQLLRKGQELYDQTGALETLATEQGFTFLLPIADLFRGWALTSQGQNEEGLGKMCQGFRGFRGPGNLMTTPYFLTLLAEGYGALDQIEAGLDALKEGEEVIAGSGDHWWAAELSRLKGDLLMRQALPDASQAEACFQQALDVSRQQQAKSLELRAAMSLVRLWQSQSKRQDAYDLLTPVYAWFTEGSDTADLIEAKALLDELEA